jgi:hypothetical protein
VVRAVATLAAVVGSCACERPPTSEQTPSREVAISSAETDPFSVSVVKTAECRAPLGIELSPGQRYLGVEIEVEATGKARVPANFFYARLYGDDWDIAPDFGGCEPQLGGSPLSRGERRRGYVNFHVPKDARNPKLSYEPRIERADTVTRGSKITLGR